MAIGLQELAGTGMFAPQDATRGARAAMEGFAAIGEGLNRIERRRAALAQERETQRHNQEAEKYNSRIAGVQESAEGRQVSSHKVEGVQAYHAARQQGDAERAERIKQAYQLTPEDTGEARREVQQAPAPAPPAPQVPPLSPMMEIAGGPQARPAALTPGMEDALSGAGFTPGGAAEAQAEHDKFLRRPPTEPEGDFMSMQNQQDLLAQRRGPLAPIAQPQERQSREDWLADRGGAASNQTQRMFAEQRTAGTPPAAAPVPGRQPLRPMDEIQMGTPRPARAGGDLPDIGRPWTDEEVRAVRGVSAFFAGSGDPDLQALLPKVPGAVLAMNGDEEKATNLLLGMRAGDAKLDAYGKAAEVRARAASARGSAVDERTKFMQGATLFSREAARLDTPETIGAYRKATETLARIDEAQNNPVVFAGLLFGLAESNDPGSRKTNEDIRQAGGMAFMSALEQGEAALVRFFEGERGQEQMQNIKRALTITAQQAAEKAAQDRESLLRTRETMDDAMRAEGFDTGMEIFGRVPGADAANDGGDEPWIP